MLASSPDRPTANDPCTFMADTISRLTLPMRTMLAISRVSASVTRLPSTNSGTLPSLAMSSPICGPPPWTTTGSMPTERMSTTSCANDANASASPASSPSVIASPSTGVNTLPPYLMTTTFPQKRKM